MAGMKDPTLTSNPEYGLGFRGLGFRVVVSISFPVSLYHPHIPYTPVESGPSSADPRPAAPQITNADQLVCKLQIVGLGDTASGLGVFF